MNFLGHAICTNARDDVVFGAVMSDLFPRSSGKKGVYIPSAIHDGRVLHRSQDDFFDTLPELSQLRTHISLLVGHFHDPVMDVAFDHFIARNWNLLFDEDFEDFTTYLYDIIRSRIEYLDPKRQVFAQAIMQYDIFGTYRSEEGFAAALGRLAKRSRRHEMRLRDRVPEIVEIAPQFDAYFYASVPILREKSSKKLEEMGYSPHEFEYLHFKEGKYLEESYSHKNAERN